MIRINNPNVPNITIVIATYNSDRTLRECLKSIHAQNYPQNKIEVILVDAGSTDNTLKIGKKYDCRIIKKKNVHSEAAKAYGLQKAKGELVADFGSDNILPGKDWLNKIIAPLQNHKDVIASYPLRYHYRKNDTILNRYVALFGVNDTVPFYLGNADRQSYLYNGYTLSGNAETGLGYYIVKFSTQNMPTLGANGFVIRKKILQKAKVDPDHYFHIDVVYDLVKMGYDKFVVVDNSIIHDTADTFVSLLKKRERYFSKLYLEQIDRRRYRMVTKDDYRNLLLFIIYSLTFIQPLILSIRGYIKKRDIAWFMHPIFCFFITFVYGKSIILNYRNRNI
jgi:glycosyltransferase involved in cell wall biosynthesis